MKKQTAMWLKLFTKAKLGNPLNQGSIGKHRNIVCDE